MPRSARSAFLSAFAACYTCAFISYYLQYEGLYGEDGLLPVASHHQKVSARLSGEPLKQQVGAHPSLLWLIRADDDTDVAMEAITMLGILCSMLATAGIHNALLFAAMFACYSTLFASGQTFLSFQWDLFLLETGAMTILYAPWLSLSADEEHGVAHPMTWVMRTVWVKFMLMSGSVKVFARCPTWRELTALEFHFASTCLPSAEAWLAHSLPPFLLRLGVAIMFVCELLAPWMLLAPLTAVRRIGVLVQLPLQVLIMATGNYNWFNLHTAALLLPAWARDVSLSHAASAVSAATVEAQQPSAPRAGQMRSVAQRLLAPLVAWEKFGAWRPCAWLSSLAALAALCHVSLATFPISIKWSSLPGSGGGSVSLATLSALLSTHDALGIENHADESFVRAMLHAALQPRALSAYLYTVTSLSALCYAIAPLASSAAAIVATDKPSAADGAAAPRETAPLLRPESAEDEGAAASPRRQATTEAPPPPAAGDAGGGGGGGGRLHAVRLAARVAWRSCLGITSLLLLGVVLLPLESIAERDVSSLVPPCFGLRERTLHLAATLRPYHASNSYGLFRRLTGVGPRFTPGVLRGLKGGGSVGWGGLAPSIVQVPVVILEGHAKLSAESAAGGDDGWVELPFRYTPYGERRAPRRTAPHQPRVDWQMWFAALGSYQSNPWLLHLIYKILCGGGGGGGGKSSSAALTLLDVDAYPFPTAPPARVRATLFHYDFTRVPSPWAQHQQAPMLPVNCSRLGPFVGGEGCDAWWKRTRVREYLPPVDRSLMEEQVVRAQGWPVGGARAPSDPCRAAKPARDATIPPRVCEAVLTVRNAVGKPLRRFVGFDPGWLGGGAAFIDGPLLVIVSVIAVAVGLGMVTARPGR